MNSPTINESMRQLDQVQCFVIVRRHLIYGECPMIDSKERNKEICFLIKYFKLFSIGNYSTQNIDKKLLLIRK